MLTQSSMIFRADRELCQEVAMCADLRHEIVSNYDEPLTYGLATHGKYDLWQDAQTGGGGCRMVWKNGIVWISRHSGYAWADITDDVAELFRMEGLKDLPYDYNYKNPHVYG